MLYKNTPQRFGAIAIFLHWLTLLLIILQVLIAILANMEPVGLTKFILLSRHKALGILILMVTLLRLVWRLISPAPALPTSMTSVERFIALSTHVCFYIMLIALPVIGWFLTSAANVSVNFFDLFILPDLIAPNKLMVEPLTRLHQILVFVLMTLLLLHILAALRHHFVIKDAILARMLPGLKQRSRK